MSWTDCSDEPRAPLLCSNTTSQACRICLHTICGVQDGKSKGSRGRLTPEAANMLILCQEFVAAELEILGCFYCSVKLSSFCVIGCRRLPSSVSCLQTRSPCCGATALDGQ